MFYLGLKKVCKLFSEGNVSVSGLKGTGKDMLVANVIYRRKKPYISNLNYNCKGSDYIPLDLLKIDTGNTFDDLIKNDIKEYHYPFPDGADFYISDAGVYFPSQYYLQLDKRYFYTAMFMALSRHLGDCNFHYNAQNLNRVWDKIREQSDIYILCRKCRVLFKKLVIEKIFIYDKYQSCIDRIKPFKPLRPPFFAKGEAKQLVATHNDQLKNKYQNEYGDVKAVTLFYFNRSKYDTRFFKTLFEKGPSVNSFSFQESVEKNRVKNRPVSDFCNWVALKVRDFVYMIKNNKKGGKK